MDWIAFRPNSSNHLHVCLSICWWQLSEGAEQEVMAQVLEKLKQQVSNRRDLKVRTYFTHMPCTFHADGRALDLHHLHLNE